MLSSSASTFFRASMMRASSPPEATFWMGLRASPTLADMRNCTSSPPVSSSPQAPSLGANSTWKRTLGMSSWRSSSCTRVWRASAACLRAWESTPARLAASSLAFSSFCLQAGDGVVGVLDLVQLLAAALQVVQHLLHRGAVLLFQPVDDIQPALQLVQFLRGEVQLLLQIPQQLRRVVRRTPQLGQLLLELAARRSLYRATPWTAPSASASRSAAPGRPRPRTGRTGRLWTASISFPGAAQQVAPRASSSSSSPGFSSARSSSPIWKLRVSTRRERSASSISSPAICRRSSAMALIGRLIVRPAAPSVCPKRSR